MKEIKPTAYICGKCNTNFTEYKDYDKLYCPNCQCAFWQLGYETSMSIEKLFGVFQVRKGGKDYKIRIN